MTKFTDFERSVWRNIWCVLRTIDLYELKESGATNCPDFDWEKFAADPHSYLIRTDDRQAHAIWKAVEKRIVMSVPTFEPL